MVKTALLYCDAYGVGVLETHKGTYRNKEWNNLAVFRIRIRPDPKLFGLKDPPIFHTKLKIMF